MKRFIENNLLGFILGLITATTIGVTASVIYNSSEIGFTPSDTNWKVNNLQDAVNDLYKGKSTAVQVATLTTPGATYTMQNDGYITGTVQSSYNENGGIIYFDDNNSVNNIAFVAQWDVQSPFNVSLYAPKNTVIHTRQNYGTYNLTVYEWK